MEVFFCENKTGRLRKIINKLRNIEPHKQIPIRRTRTHNLTLLKEVGEIPPNAKYGKVCSIVGNQVIVETSENNTTIHYSCVPAGAIISRNSNLSNLIAAGDNVWFITTSDSLGSIIKIDERKQILSRTDPSNHNREQILAANVDNLIIFFSTVEPALNTRMIERYVIAAKLGTVNPIICINKMDLVNNVEQKDIYSIFQDYKLPCFFISALNSKGIEPVKKILKNKESVISGPSGAGKSTFLNNLIGYKAQAVNEISEYTNKGLHTTSFSKRYSLHDNTAIIDTPGLREFGIWNLRKDELALFFDEFLEYFYDCQFTDCTHTHEPHCAVKAAVQEGKISEARYMNYLSIYDTL